jgi:hypothetical protein
VTDYKLLKRLEAAIGIEPMNKAFADMANVFAQVRVCSIALMFIEFLRVSNSRVIAQIQVCVDC